MVVSRDFQEVSVLECILGGLHIGVDVESSRSALAPSWPSRRLTLSSSTVTFAGASSFLKGLQDGTIRNAVPLIIVSGSGRPEAP